MLSPARFRQWALPSTAAGRLIGLLNSRGGEVSGGLRAIGDAIGLGRTATGDLLATLSAAGRVRVVTGRKGTCVTLVMTH